MLRTPPTRPIEQRAASWDVEVFFDGECPLCRREVAFLRRRDARGRVRFTDIARPDFDAGSIGRELPELMARIHGRLPDGTLIEGVEVFRRVYEAVGFGTLTRLSRLPGVSGMLDVLYGLFAKNRLRLTGRCSDDVCGVHARQATASNTD